MKKVLLKLILAQIFAIATLGFSQLKIREQIPSSYNKSILTSLPVLKKADASGTVGEIFFHGPYALKKYIPSASEEEETKMREFFEREIFTLVHLKGINANYQLLAFDLAERKMLTTRIQGQSALKMITRAGNEEQRRERATAVNKKFILWLAKYHSLTYKNFKLKNTVLTKIRYQDIEEVSPALSSIHQEIKKITDESRKQLMLEEYQQFMQEKVGKVYLTWAVNDLDINNYFPIEDVFFDFNDASLAPIESDLASLIYTLWLKETDHLCSNENYDFIKQEITENIVLYLKQFRFFNSRFNIDISLLRRFLARKLIQQSMYVDPEWQDKLLEKSLRLFSFIEDDKTLDKTLDDLVN